MLNNQNRASEIIEAIEAYHADHKQYPESLHELTTYNYISEIPRTEAGATFEYKVYPLGDPVDKYILLFYTGTNSSCAFAPYIDRWDCGYFDH